MMAFVKTRILNLERDAESARFEQQVFEAFHEWPFMSPKNSDQKQVENFEDVVSTQLRNLSDTVIKSAIDLQKEMACSPFRYWLKPPEIPSDELPSFQVLSQWSLKNIDDWTEMGSDDDISGVYRCLFSGVYRFEIGDHTQVDVVKPVVLVFTTHRVLLHNRLIISDVQVCTSPVRTPQRHLGIWAVKRRSPLPNYNPRPHRAKNGCLMPANPELENPIGLSGLRVLRLSKRDS